MKQFHAYGAVASESLIRALIAEHGRWADAVLTQSFKVPLEYREALLAGEAEWKILNPSTIIIGLVRH